MYIFSDTYNIEICDFVYAQSRRSYTYQDDIFFGDILLVCINLMDAFVGLQIVWEWGGVGAFC